MDPCGSDVLYQMAEAIPLRKAIGGVVENFLKENIIIMFEVPHKIISDNGTPFVNSEAEATNKTLIKIISKMNQEYTGGWAMHLPDALWTFRSSPKSTTGFSPFSLAYGIEVMSPAEVMTPSLRVM
ncbi:uncharacterized protein LOC142605771 [Castanea sativa]|uniref:uncharacterized protein LOC142605771 n=1 Tax=Castanea sativa TaxID=21020 RepID=UPI003F64E12F